MILFRLREIMSLKDGAANVLIKKRASDFEEIAIYETESSEWLLVFREGNCLRERLKDVVEEFGREGAEGRCVMR